MKSCKDCGERKSLDDFYYHRTTKDKRQGICKTCWSRANRERNAANPDSRRRYKLHKKYGITLKQYDEMLIAQERRCACCDTDTPGGKHNASFYVDHDHETGKVRGLLCHACNTAVGLMGDSVEGVMKVLTYLQNQSNL